MTLTKRDLVSRISENSDLSQAKVYDVIQKTLDHIAEAMAKGDKVEFRKFGVFEVAIGKPRVGRNPKWPNKPIRIPARAIVKFTAGKGLKAEVRKLTPKLANKKA